MWLLTNLHLLSYHAVPCLAGTCTHVENLQPARNLLSSDHLVKAIKRKTGVINVQQSSSRLKLNPQLVCTSPATVFQILKTYTNPARHYLRAEHLRQTLWLTKTSRSYPSIILTTQKSDVHN